MINMLIRMADIPVVNVDISVINPRSGDNKAPHETPIIINADISFECFMSCCNASEHTLENTFAQARPIKAIDASNIHKDELIIIVIKAKTPKISVIRKNLTEDNFIKRKAPIRVPMVRAAKYKLVPKAASSRIIPVLYINNLGILVFRATSMPTISRMTIIQ